MIPLQLTLKNFLSYREATLDFRGFHTACICGANGAGKSSLLEAIAWSLWGESRAVSEDDLIHAGEREVRVDFIFQKDGQIFRAIRSRQLGQSSSLEFQVQSAEGFRSLTAKGVRATQQLLIETLKLDYETFVNSAYLRQGRADEFMLKRPTERKEILASLLRLDQYDQLAEQAKERSRHFKAQVELLKANLQRGQIQLQSQADLPQELIKLETAIAKLQSSQTLTRQQLQSWQTLSHQQQTQRQQLEWQQQQYANLVQDCQQLSQELTHATQQQRELESLIAQENAIAQAYTHFQSLQVLEESLSEKFSLYQQLQEQRRQLFDAQTEQCNELNHHIRLIQSQLDQLNQQEQDIQQTLNRQAEVEAGLEQLKIARDRLAYLDRLQLQVAPIHQRRQQLQNQIDRTQTRLTAKLEELNLRKIQLQQQASQAPQLQQAAQEITSQIEQLEKKRVYQQRVLEKGQERRGFMERLHSDQRGYETQLAELNQKLQMLQRGMQENQEETEFPPCPLCDRPLDEHHWNLVQQKHHTQQQEILDRIWVVREQLATSEREIQVLRNEYQQLTQEIAQLTPALERRGQLQAHLDVTGEIRVRIQQITTEVSELEHLLQTGDYASEFQAELRLLDSRLQQLNYDEKDHALARGKVDRCRWAEIKKSEIKTALKRQEQIQAQRLELESQLTQLHRRLEQLRTNSQVQRHLESFDREIQELGYNLEEHNQIRTALREIQSSQLQYHQLSQAKQQYPQIGTMTRELAKRLQERSQEKNFLNAQIANLQQQLSRSPDATQHIQTLETQLQQQQEQLSNSQLQLGRLQQQQQQLETLKAQIDVQQQQLQDAQRQYRVYQELAQAFGRNGIQSLMIENVLPQLEAETNAVLGRLSANQLHIQFVTQKAGKSAKGKLIDTLDILIADSRGTRPYETYSGGEAFRVNFAIRLSLAKLLAQRAGTSLQMLIVDEGFGTQDQEGCDRLVASINAIAPDFACILTITHMPYFKEAFQARIEVTKTAEGSQLSLSL